jgi:GrpB-like predicted nucleotidyltransferase (UPF0157 family)
MELSFFLEDGAVIDGGGDVVVVEYDESWDREFEELARPIRGGLGDVAAVLEHVGSTAVAGLAAKPAIDIDVVVRSVREISVVIERLARLGYVHQGDLGIAGREAFQWPSGTQRHHVYAVVEGTSPHRDHIDFRDYLRANPDEARAYAELKKQVAREHAGDRAAYSAAKSDFILEALRRARARERS